MNFVLVMFYNKVIIAKDSLLMQTYFWWKSKSWRKDWVNYRLVCKSRWVCVTQRLWTVMISVTWMLVYGTIVEMRCDM